MMIPFEEFPMCVLLRRYLTFVTIHFVVIVYFVSWYAMLVFTASSSVPLLIDGPLTTSVLSTLHNLTQFENLQPRFNAIFPPCWTEIQQEQQQRKHPQHLHHKHGDASLHTRTWRLQPDRYSIINHATLLAGLGLVELSVLVQAIEAIAWKDLSPK